MKKIIYIVLLTIFASFTSRAQDVRGFRGFFDLYGGKGVGEMKETFSNSYENITNIKSHITVGLNFTAGYQVNKMLFGGIGFGMYASSVEYAYNQSLYTDVFCPAVLFPVFVDCRWTLDLNRRITPFVDLKIGYQFACATGDSELYTDDDPLYINQDGGFYMQPTVGVRFGKASGFNLGITYNPTIHQKISRGFADKEIVLKKFTQGAFMVSLGADF